MKRTGAPLPPTGLRLAVGVFAGVGLSAVALTVVYLQRGPIAARLAAEYLRQRGVRAVVRIDHLDRRGFSGAAELGPGNDPGLTIDRIEGEFAPGPHGGLAPRLIRLRLVRPHLKARFDGHRLQFGSLQGLIDDALSKPSAGGSGPDVSIQDGRLQLSSPYGEAVLVGDGVLNQGRLTHLTLSLASPGLHGRGVSTDALQGEFAAQTATHGGLKVDLHLRTPGLQAPAVSARGVELRLDAQAPNGLARLPNSGERLIGAATLDAQDLRRKDAEIVGMQSVVQLDGSVRTPARRLAFSGHMAIRLAGRSAHAHAANLQQFAVALASPNLSAAWADHAVTVDGDYDAKLDGSGGAVELSGRRLGLDALAATGAGRLKLEGSRAQLSYRGAASFKAAMGRGDASAIAQVLAPGPELADIRDRLAANLTGVSVSAPRLDLAVLDGGYGVRLDAPLAARFAQGAALQVSSQPEAPAASLAGGAVNGALSATLAGPGLPRLRLQLARYRVGSDTGGLMVDAAGVLDGEGSAGPVRDARLHGAASINRRGGSLTVTAKDCATVGLGAYAGRDATVLRAVNADLCPTSEPVAVLGSSGWRISTRLANVAGELPTLSVVLQDAQGDLTLQGQGRSPPRGSLTLVHAELKDTGTTPRFRPLSASGEVHLADQLWRGDLGLQLVGPTTTLGRLTFQQDQDHARGEARLQTPDLQFKPGGLQPASIAPVLGRWVSNVNGIASGVAELHWGDGPMSSRATLQLKGLNLRSSAGPLSGLKGEVAFTSLDPLLTAPGQILNADRLDALLPLTNVTTAFSLTPSALKIDGASAEFAGGSVSLDPTRLPLNQSGDAATMSGVVRLHGVDVQQLLAGLNLADAMNVQAKVNGELPFALGPAGVRLAAGRLSADGPGRLTIHRQALMGAVATGGASGAQPNAVQDFAYQALEDLAFESLDADVASRPPGRLGLILHIKGRHDPATDVPTRIGIFQLLRGHAFDTPLPLPKGTPVDLTLDTSLNLDELLAAYASLKSQSSSGGVQP